MYWLPIDKYNTTTGNALCRYYPAIKWPYDIACVPIPFVNLSVIIDIVIK